MTVMTMMMLKMMGEMVWGLGDNEGVLQWDYHDDRVDR